MVRRMSEAPSKTAETADSRPDFRDVEAWVFDLDHTLYAMSAEQQAAMEERICLFVQRHFAPDLKVAVMKGRSNFLCRLKLHQMEGQPVLKGLEEMDCYAQIRDWERLTETGDRAELSFLPDDAELWARLDARRETCT